MIEPIVPAGLDLTSFDFMPVEWARLLASDTWLLSNDAEKVAAITLWGRSWSQVPAGSLPSDDRLLALLSGAGARWKRVKTTALRGWVQASDGRLYHPIICEKALEAWLEKLASQLSSGAGNKKRWGAEFDPEPIKAQMAEARERLKTLNPDSRQLRKRRFAAHSDAVPDESQQHPGGMPSRSQLTVTVTGTEKLPSDTSSRLEVSEGSSERLARALHEVGYPECAASYPGLADAEREGVTPQELAAIAIKHQGKPLAYVIETARGRRRDAIERAARNGQASPAMAAIDPAMAEEAVARHERDRLISQANGDFEMELIGADVRDRRISEAKAAFRERFPGRGAPAVVGREATA